MNQNTPAPWLRKPLPLAIASTFSLGMMFSSAAHAADAPAHQILADDIAVSDWAFRDDSASLVAAAQVAGLYAVADDKAQRIEIRDVHQKGQLAIGYNVIKTTVPDADLEYGLCGMTFTPSGRFLYLAVCTEGDGPDTILALNTNTKRIGVLDEIKLTDEKGSRVGMTFFKDQLYVGSEKGIIQYHAHRNALLEGSALGQGKLIESDGRVSGLAVDMLRQQIYATTPSGLHRIGPNGTALVKVADAEHLTGLTMGRTYGNAQDGGLFLLQNDGDNARILTLGNDELGQRGPQTLTTYTDQIDAKLADIAATADGGMLLAQGEVKRMFSTSDQRLGYDAWLMDELDSYLTAIKSLVVDGEIAGTNTINDKQGELIRQIVAEGNSPSQEPIADNVGWALFLLMAIDQVKKDPDIEKIVELLIQTHAGLHPEGHGGVRTVDGHFVRVYGRDGLPAEGINGRGQVSSQPQVYVSMKYLPAAIKAVEMYPDNDNLKLYAEYLRQLVQRSSDTIRAEQRITWTNDDHGPLDINNLMANETWIFGDIGAAQDPYATTDYATYSYDRSSFRTDNWLLGEPVIMASHAAFIVNGATLILNHHFDGEGWKDQNHNYFGITMAATDEMGAPYFGAFSAGNHPRTAFDPKNPDSFASYYNEGPSDHPNNILHFPAVMGFGQHGYTSPMVGAYMAYRDGRRQMMSNYAGGESFPMLTRFSMDDHDWRMRAVGIADFWYGGIGLVETIAPGTIAKLRGDFYRPYVKEVDGELIYSNMTPRRVVGIDKRGKRTEYGFQTSPYTLPQLHDSYEVIDPQGDWIELEDLVNQLDGKPMRFTNPHFERGLDGWTLEGEAKIVEGAGSQAVALSAGASISQTLDLTLDFDNTRFIVHTLGEIQSRGAKGELRLRWSKDGNLANVVGDSRSLPIGKDPVMQIKTAKPTGANFLHIEYVGEKGEVRFENLGVMRRGADAGLPNGDFANGKRHWDLGHGVEIVNNKERATVGDRALRLRRGPGITGWQSASRELDIANDPLGTRYLFRFDASTVGDDFKFEVLIEAFDNKGKRVVERRDIGDILPGHEGERTVTIRKRPEYETFKLTMRMKRNSADSKGRADVFVDNFRLDKERVFFESDCVEGSATACLPTRLELMNQ
ncbi:hypothetical protein [Ferrimonas pelagia]